MRPSPSLLLPLVAVVGLSALAAQLLRADELPVDQQVPLLLKVLGYDRNLETKAGAEVVVAIVHDPADRESVAATEQMAGALSRQAGKTVKKLPLRHCTVEYTSAAELEGFVKAQGVSVFYVTPGNDRNLADILVVAQARHVTTTTGLPDYVRKGVAVGVGLVDDKPQIFINLGTSRAEGSDFDAALLRIATILGPR